MNAPVDFQTSLLGNSTASAAMTMATTGLPQPYTPLPTAAPLPPKVITPPKPPSWVKGDPALEKKADRRAAGARNAKLVTEANKSKTRYDFVLFGDSITQFVADKNMDIWNKHFGTLKKSAPLGVSGNTVEELSWRVALGKERFAVSPKCVALLIGINNVKNPGVPEPSEKLDTFLLPYMRAVWPESKIILLGLMPNKFVDVSPTNARYKKIAEKHGVQYALCGTDMVATNTKDFKDGTHPATDGYHKFYSCLKPLVTAAIASFQ